MLVVILPPPAQDVSYELPVYPYTVDVCFCGALPPPQPEKNHAGCCRRTAKGCFWRCRVLLMCLTLKGRTVAEADWQIALLGRPAVHIHWRLIEISENVAARPCH